MMPHTLLYADSTAVNATSPNLSASPTNNNNNNNQHAYHPNITSFFQNPSTSLGQLITSSAQLDPAAYLHLSQDPQNRMVLEAKCEDDYGFLFDFDASNDVPSSLEDMGFDDHM
ncbi:hypothetical protein Salat_2253300 [Sesamum alatum]|uniref:Uncharacterized protein n=1 Tax=Sesamum alatum TaxID=300844 RepID=A0AAE1XUW0_9LAMI|nr:hypothetical protein Salat_2253300 [Sesamum alatum]